MRIEFRRGGGFAAPAMQLAVTLDTCSLPAEEAEELRSLLRSADLPSIAASRPAAGAQPRPDMFHYRVVLNPGEGEHALELSDADMPPSVRPLIEWLSKRATDGGRARTPP